MKIFILILLTLIVFVITKEEEKEVYGMTLKKFKRGNIMVSIYLIPLFLFWLFLFYINSWTNDDLTYYILMGFKIVNYGYFFVVLLADFGINRTYTNFFMIYFCSFGIVFSEIYIKTTVSLILMAVSTKLRNKYDLFF